MSAKQRGLPGTKKMRHSAHYIDDLLGESGFGDSIDFKIIPIERIKPSETQPRQELGDIDNLSESIKSKGVLEPVIVCRVETNSYRIVSGERRYRASMKAGQISLPCIVKNVTEVEEMEIALIENLQRKDLNPFEEAYGYNFLIEKFSYTHENVGRIVGKGRTSITETLSLLTLPERIRILCIENGVFQKSILTEIVRLKSEKEMEEYLILYINGATREEIRDLKKNNSNKKANRNYTFKYSDKELPFTLSLKFKKTHVEKQEVVKALETLLEKIKTE